MEAAQATQPRPRGRTALGLGLALALLGAGPAGYAGDRLAQRGRVARGVVACGESLEGLTPEQAYERLAEAVARLGGRDLAVSIGGQRFSLPPSRYGFRVDVDPLVWRAMAVGRSGTARENLSSWLSRLGGSEVLGVEPALDVAALRKDLLAFAAQAIADPPFEGAIAVEQGKAGSAPPREGTVLDVDEAVRRIERALVSRDAVLVELPLKKQAPKTSAEAVAAAFAEAKQLLAGDVVLEAEGGEKLTLGPVELGEALVTRAEGAALVVSLDEQKLGPARERAQKLLGSPAREARVWVDDKDRVHVEPSQSGTRVDGAALAKAALAAAKTPERKGKLPVEVGAEPKFTTADAERLGIRALVAKFETRHPCCQKRVDNIHRIADLVNGAIVRPGERFSVNELVGPRTEARGFVLAPSIADGEMVDTPGGGVSQFATTLYNAVLEGGYPILERKPHSFYFSRYPLGHEATLSFPHPDLVFKNDTEAGLLIKVEYGPTWVRVKLFGDNGGRRVQRKVSKRFDFTKPRIELVPNDKVPPDEEKVKEHGSRGFSVITSRVVTLPDGTKREEKRTVIYKPRERVLAVHSCKIPKGEKGWTGRPCPKPEDVSGGEEPAARPKEPDEE